MKDRKKQQPVVCRLDASGFTETLDDVYDWAKAVVAEVRKCLSGEPVKASVWAYREQGVEWLAVDFILTEDGCDRGYNMTFLVGEPHDYALDVLSVPDMTEALHLVGILSDALGATIELGRRCNEVNRYCTPETWVSGQTNARLALPAA